MCPVVRNGSKQDETAGQGKAGNPVSAEKPAPALAPRIRSLLKDLAAEDLPMAMLDLVQLSRALSGLSGSNLNDEYRASTWICTEDGTGEVGICDGPDYQGLCPWADSESKLPCKSQWLMTSGWMFKVTEDAVICPLAALGLSHTPTEDGYSHESSHHSRQPTLEWLRDRSSSSCDRHAGVRGA